ncbi:YcxB family protein [Oleiharenicola lentus]|uniref:YcxB family protein n=1 Tax=Oleiharenicola lentus TaxID=2508720 RepID=UPI003F662B09
MKITFQLTADDCIAARRLAMRPRPSLRRIGYIISILFLLFLLCQGYEVFTQKKPQHNFWFITAVVSYFSALYFVVIPWKTKRIFSQQKTLQSVTELELTDTHFKGSSAHGTCKIAWEEFHKWKKNEHLVLVYQSEALMHMIPLRAFQTTTDKERLTSILKLHLGEERA